MASQREMPRASHFEVDGRTKRPAASSPYMDSSRLSSGRFVTRCPSSRLRSYIRPVRGGLLSACFGVGRTKGPWVTSLAEHLGEVW